MDSQIWQYFAVLTNMRSIGVISNRIINEVKGESYLLRCDKQTVRRRSSGSDFSIQRTAAIMYQLLEPFVFWMKGFFMDIDE